MISCPFLKLTVQPHNPRSPSSSLSQDPSLSNSPPNKRGCHKELILNMYQVMPNSFKNKLRLNINKTRKILAPSWKNNNKSMKPNNNIINIMSNHKRTNNKNMLRNITINMHNRIMLYQYKFPKHNPTSQSMMSQSNTMEKKGKNINNKSIKVTSITRPDDFWNKCTYPRLEIIQYCCM